MQICIMKGKQFPLLDSWTGHSGVVAFATWPAYFGVILGQVAYKII